MNFFLLVFSVFLQFLLFFLSLKQNGFYTKLRVSLILALMTNAVLVFMYNELSSSFNLLQSFSAVGFWGAIVLLLCVLFIRLTRKGKINTSQLHPNYLLSQWSSLNRPTKLISLAALFIFIVPLLFLAVYVPPNNFDAHSYHLNRILSWVNNGNLNHFPTEHIQQLYHNVFAEYLVLDTVLLSGSDRYTGLIQFGAFLGAMSGVSLIAKKLGLKANGQFLAAVLMLTLPIGIFESTSAQVDYVSCFFFIAYVYFGFALLEKKSTLHLLAFATALALGGFTKYTIFMFALPFTVYFGIRILQQYGFLYGIRVFILAAGLLILFFTPFLIRNYQLFGQLISPMEKTRLFAEKLPVEHYSPLLTLSGILKNSGLHMGLPDSHFNQFVYTQIKTIHTWMGINMDDPDYGDVFSVRYSVQEDMVPNTFHFWLMGLATIVLLFSKGHQRTKWLWICAIAGFVMFCTMLKFQLWSSRTHMPFFAMGCVVIAYVYDQILHWKIQYLAVPMMLFSTVFVYGNPNKPMIPLSYLARKAVAHIPVAICSTSPENEADLQKKLGDYYVFPGKDGCHPLKQTLNFTGRSEVFSILDETGYYDDDKLATVFTTDRVKAYFLSHLDHYYNFKPLLDHIEGENKNIGVLFSKGSGFYHYWSAVSTKLANPGQMRYIAYKKEFLILDNAKNTFCYDYILSDDLSLLEKTVPAQNIEAVYHSPALHLVKLKQRSCERVLF